MADWKTSAKDRLLELRGQRPGWGYRPDTDPFVEPTVLASWALLASDPSVASWMAQPDDNVAADAFHRPRTLPSDRASSVVKEAADWLASIQQGDGSVGLAAHLPEPRWPTAYALLLWALFVDRGDSRRRATGWLFGEKGKTYTRAESGAVGHDASIVGWPWAAGTHSWIEPTAISILAIHRQGFGNSVRVLDGVRLILDRAIETGGWNYGNKVVFDAVLRPQPGPSGIALLALSAANVARNEIIESAIAYLQAELPGVRSAQSLAWGLLGLSAWDSAPAGGSEWLAETYALIRDRSDPAPQLAYVLMAAHARTTLALLGVSVRGRPS